MKNGFAVTLAPDVVFKPNAGLHVNEAGVAPALPPLAINTMELPAQMLADAGLMVIAE